MNVASYVCLAAVLGIGFLGDLCLKWAAMELGSGNNQKAIIFGVAIWVLWGAAVYPWMVAIKDNGLITFTVMFLVTHTLLCVGIGLYYHESMSAVKAVGIVLAIVSSVMIIKG